MQEEYDIKLTEYLQKFAKRPNDHQYLIKELVSMPLSYVWQILQQILDQMEHTNEFQYKNALRHLENLLPDVKSFTMLTYLYAIARDNPNFARSIYWKAYYIRLALDGGQITIFSTWVSLQPQSQIVQDSLWLIISTFPALFRNEHIEMSEIELNSVIEWVTYFRTVNEQVFGGVCEIVKLAKETHLYIREDYIRKEHLILKKLIEIAGQSGNSSSNVFLFIYPFTLQEKQISYFCHVYCDFLTGLAQDNIINFFKAITKSAISKQLVFLIFKISQLLKNEEEYFKLRVIYQDFILPYLARRAKSCVKVEEYVYDLCSYYILGFLKHCNIGDEGIQCLVSSIDKIKNSQTRNKWVQLCGVMCYQYPEQKSEILKKLKKAINGNIEFNYQKWKQDLQNEEIVWSVTIRSGRKHKKYPKVLSKMKGIQNKNNQCYIISTVQGLQKTHLLGNMLEAHRSQIKNKFPLLDELRVLFGEISGKRMADTIKVSYLKKRGPQYFTESLHQEDVQHYLIELFNAIQNECSQVPGLLKQFKNIFEISISGKIVCSSCKNQVQQQQTEYIYTIPHTHILQQVSEEEQLTDYSCQKCKQKQCKMIRKIQPISKILIVHINRFSHENGTTYKELSTQMIHRKFLKYTLVGMICHIGKNVEHGHYIYYARIGEKRWAQFNDRYVEEFQLEDPNEEFQREMKAQMTPYILFYKEI